MQLESHSQFYDTYYQVSHHLAKPLVITFMIMDKADPTHILNRAEANKAAFLLGMKR